MKTPRLLIVIGAIVAAALSCWLAAAYAQSGAPGPTAPAKANPTTVAVADLLHITDGLEELRDIKAQLAAKETRLKAEDAERGKAITQLQSDLDMAGSNPAEKARILKQLRQKIGELKVWREVSNLELQQDQADQTELLYRKCLDAIGRVAQQVGADLVLFKEQQPDFRNADIRTLAGLIQMRKVLWSAPSLDITDQVVLMMNNEYKNKGGPTTRP
jgi:Skp family chaperone for outer membrane proteins